MALKPAIRIKVPIRGEDEKW